MYCKVINLKTVKQKILYSKNNKPPIFKLTNRLILFFFLFSCIIFIFYTVGNWQDFLDKSQKLLLYITTVSSIFLLCFMVCGFILIIVYSFKQKTVYFLRFIPLYIIYAVIGILIILFGSAISFFSR